MSVDSLQQQITSVVRRLNLFQRRAEAHSESPKILRQALDELEAVVDVLHGAQEQLVENRRMLEVTQQELRRERDKYLQLFDSAPEAYLVTGPQSEILEANRAAAELLNISQRHLAGKVLSMFVSDERAKFTTQTAHLAHAGGSADWMLRLRPRERAPVEVVARVTAASAADGTLCWMLRPVGARLPE